MHLEHMYLKTYCKRYMIVLLSLLIIKSHCVMLLIDVLCSLLSILNQHASTALFANLDINSYFIAIMQKGHYLTSCLCLFSTNCFNIALHACFYVDLSYKLFMSVKSS